MNFIFADDSKQNNPTREDMKPLIGLGGIHVSAEDLSNIEVEMDELCKNYNFPKGEEFKWSPRKGTYMHSNIIEQERIDFYKELFEISSNYNITAIVVASNIECRCADPSSNSHEEDVITMFLERADQLLNSNKRNGLVIIDKPGGGHKQVKALISKCLETLERGTDYVKFDSIPLPVMTADSKHIRLLQLADVVIGCCLARLAGELKYSPETFKLIKPLLRKEFDRIGGVGFKIHPDLRYKNLYHWLLGDEFLKRGDAGGTLPEKGYPYYENPGESV
jgi:hypothetical protein